VQIGKRGRTPNELTTIFVLDDVEYQIPAKPSPALVLKWMRGVQGQAGHLGQSGEGDRLRCNRERPGHPARAGGPGRPLAESPEVTEDDVADVFAIVSHIFFGAMQSLQRRAARPFLARVAEWSWILDYLDEIESDLSRFHRVDDINTLGSSRFFSLVRLLPVYGGALAFALRRDLAPELNSPAPEASNPHYASGEFPTYDGATLAAMTEGPGEFPGIEHSGA
jgi:hypothetical protein